MTHYTLTYGRKIQTRPYEMLTIELSHEFETSLTGHDEAFTYMRDWVDGKIEAERRRLGAS